MRFDLDVTKHRAALQLTLTLVYDGGEHEVPIDVADLDTGSAFGLVGPLRTLPTEPRDGRRETVVTLNGPVRGVGFSGLLRFGQGERRWEEPNVEVVVHRNFERWLVGMQVLRRFHLLLPHEQLATDDEVAPSRPR